MFWFWISIFKYYLEIHNQKAQKSFDTKHDEIQKPILIKAGNTLCVVLWCWYGTFSLIFVITDLKDLGLHLDEMKFKTYKIPKATIYENIEFPIFPEKNNHDCLYVCFLFYPGWSIQSSRRRLSKEGSVSRKLKN